MLKRSRTLRTKISKPSSSNGKLIACDHLARGLQESSLLYTKYRFNQSFHLIGADNFLKDLFNDKTVLSSFGPVSATFGCSNVRYKKLNSQVINMAFFDVLKEKKVVMDDWTIKGDFDEWVDGI